MNARTVTFIAPRRVELREISLKALAPGQALLRTRLSAISSGSEMLVYRGEAPAHLAADATLASLPGSLAYPLAYGYASVAVVEQVGSPAEREWIGRRAF
ncbi:MAG: oxidoreductase, partial [Chloroflexi bacterium]|nr:oxidoreductase [Chloroflexota bacterium]